MTRLTFFVIREEKPKQDQFPLMIYLQAKGDLSIKKTFFFPLLFGFFFTSKHQHLHQMEDINDETN
jgi:hypothetical protein